MRGVLREGDVLGFSPLKWLSLVGLLAAVALGYFLMVPGAFGTAYYTVRTYDDTEGTVIVGETTAGYLLTFHNTGAEEFDVKVPRRIKRETPLGVTFASLTHSHVQGTSGDGDRRVEYTIECNAQSEFDVQCDGTSISRAWMNYIGMERDEN